eukprot:CAMPEP_0177275644 /NCGR_PEP_ID=MMETSP0367-20130122/67837_1 /TAXON_ID=447022 ORGANISM="Scrippsiella hangoei-like, Strain SHHI-4" /NCGR_SAMPLE_ID=MMETSP0367 /ASSEMBLY_ACC=CAM_ASM_000362 /LENGTH=123 /DNA_ID=CAMNT_0018732113 /DNA_START=25 /DNA_END=394 /DNA_ORIENTATION=+
MRPVEIDGGTVPNWSHNLVQQCDRGCVFRTWVLRKPLRDAGHIPNHDGGAEGGTVPNWPYNLVQQMSERLDVQSSGVESRLGSIETQLQNLHAELSGVKTVPERTDNVVKQLSELLDTKLSGT